MANLAKSVKVFPPGLLLLCTLLGANALAELPQNNYACQVQTKAGVAGLVLVQTDTMAKAEKASSAAKAHKLGGGESPALSVVECIDTARGSFRDSYFQNFYEKFPK